jgi:hypothetical protein
MKNIFKYNILWLLEIFTTHLILVFLDFFPARTFMKKVLYNRHIDAYNALPFPIELRGGKTQQLDFGITQRGATFSVCFPDKFAPLTVQFS